jgi:hypothetical protein
VRARNMSRWKFYENWKWGEQATYVWQREGSRATSSIVAGLLLGWGTWCGEFLLLLAKAADAHGGKDVGVHCAACWDSARDLADVWRLSGNLVDSRMQLPGCQPPPHSPASSSSGSSSNQAGDNICPLLLQLRFARCTVLRTTRASPLAPASVQLAPCLPCLPLPRSPSLPPAASAASTGRPEAARADVGSCGGTPRQIYTLFRHPGDPFPVLVSGQSGFYAVGLPSPSAALTCPLAHSPTRCWAQLACPVFTLSGLHTLGLDVSLCQVLPCARPNANHAFLSDASRRPSKLRIS